jgi:hypothetical protein
VEKCLIGLLLLYTSQNLLGTIFRVTFTVSYRRIWDIVGKYSILCCDKMIQVCSFISLLFSAGYPLLYASVVRDVVGQ